MSSIALKLTTLLIRTGSKPIANRIKQQAREHAQFRQWCVSLAQRLHRADMRLRLGLLRDTPSSSSSSSKKDSAEEQTAKKSEDSISKTKDKDRDDKKTTVVKQRIRPLSEAKAIDAGANFISEAFLFMVAGGLIVLEQWRSRRKENNRREDIAERLAALEESERNARRAVVALEKEILELESGKKPITGRKHPRILPRELWEMDEADDDDEREQKKRMGWWAWLGSFVPARGVAGDTAKKNPASEPSPVKTVVGDDPLKNTSKEPIPVIRNGDEKRPPLAPPAVTASLRYPT
ncbi:MAG: Cell cycle serine/threonine-protein kinase cdc5/MSD2 [Watsoniomyces obsoletus]|nr:MAG: Cell cycle serine/threonine-protein kinase cdc5/MSD2 [Watsoniomyces obsoletus]